MLKVGVTQNEIEFVKMHSATLLQVLSRDTIFQQPTKTGRSVNSLLKQKNLVSEEILEDSQTDMPTKAGASCVQIFVHSEFCNS